MIDSSWKASDPEQQPWIKRGRQARASPEILKSGAKAYMPWIHICTWEISDPLPKVLLGNLTELLP